MSSYGTPRAASIGKGVMAAAAETSPRSPPSSGGWVAASILLAIAAASLGDGAGILVGVLPPSLPGWGCLALAAIVVGGLGGAILSRRVQASYAALQATSGAAMAALQAEAARIPQFEEDATTRRAKLRQMRHDIRGALSPALLASDRLLASSDPTVKRSAEIMVRSVERAITLLADTPEANPPAGP